MSIKPIETVYNGYHFRSRLEARWAVFFDAAGIKYEYEPEGFDVGNGICYLPDFYLPNVELRHTDERGLYIEVKGHLTDDDKLKIDLFSGCKAFVDGKIQDTVDYWYYTGHKPPIDEARPIMCVGKIPNGFDGGWTWHELDEDEHYYWTFAHIDGDEYWCDFYRKKDGSVCVSGPDNDYMMDNGLAGFYAFNDAFRAARQARFEHGEKPNVRRVVV